MILGGRQPFHYAVEITASANNVQAAGNIIFDTATDFEWTGTAVTTNLSAATAANGFANGFIENNCTILVQDGPSGWQLMNGPVRQAVFAGNAFQQFLRLTPVIIQRGSTFVFTVTNTTQFTTGGSSQSLTVAIALLGYKLIGGAVVGGMATTGNTQS